MTVTIRRDAAGNFMTWRSTTGKTKSTIVASGRSKLMTATPSTARVRLESVGGVYINLPFNSPEVQAEVKKLRERVTASPEAATAFLQSAGILTPTGRLSKRHGG